MPWFLWRPAEWTDPETLMWKTHTCASCPLALTAWIAFSHLAHQALAACMLNKLWIYYLSCDNEKDRWIKSALRLVSQSSCSSVQSISSTVSTWRATVSHERSNDKIYSRGRSTTPSPAVTKLWRHTGKISLIFYHGPIRCLVPPPWWCVTAAKYFFFLISSWGDWRIITVQQGGSWHIDPSGGCTVPERTLGSMSGHVRPDLVVCRAWITASRKKILQQYVICGHFRGLIEH